MNSTHRTVLSVLTIHLLWHTPLYADHTHPPPVDAYHSAHQVLTQTYTNILHEGSARATFEFAHAYQSVQNGDKRERSREIGVTPTVTYALREGFEIFAALPFGHRSFREYEPELTEREDRMTLGDLRVGARYTLMHESASYPEVTVQLSLTAPTGNRPKEQVLLEHAGWMGSASIALVRSYEWAHLFGRIGIGAGGIHGAPFVEYAGGIGISISDHWDVGVSLEGTVPTRTIGERFADRALIGPSVTYLSTDKRFAIEPYARKGLTKNSPDYELGIGVSYHF